MPRLSRARPGADRTMLGLRRSRPGHGTAPDHHERARGRGHGIEAAAQRPGRPRPRWRSRRRPDRDLQGRAPAFLPPRWAGRPRDRSHQRGAGGAGLADSREDRR